jgi:ferredoxin
MALKIIIDRKLCESNFQCHEIDDQLFQIDEEADELVVPTENVSDLHEQTLMRAEQICPKGAITIQSVSDD